MQGTELSAEEIRARIKATIPRGEWHHFKWELLSDRAALSLISVGVNHGDISLDQVLNVTEGVVKILLLDSIKGMIIEGIIGLTEIFALTEPPSEDFLKFFTLDDEVKNILKIKKNAEYQSLVALVSSGVVNHKQLFYLEMFVYNLLIDDLVRRAMIDSEVSLTQLQKVAELVDELLNFDGVYELIDDGNISIGCICNFVEQYGQNAYILRNTVIQEQVRDGQLDISSLSPVDVGLLVMDHALIEAKELSIASLRWFAECLSVTVQQEAMSYLEGRASPETLEQFHDFSKIIMEVQKKGVGVIWKHIEDRVANLLFSDFVQWRSRELDYSGNIWRILPDIEDGVDFIAYEANSNRAIRLLSAGDVWRVSQREACAIFRKQINVGSQVVLGDLSIFQAQVQDSKGHDEYFLSAISREKAVFFDIAEAQYHHRHSSPEAQRAHDKRFGLVVLPSQ